MGVLDQEVPSNGTIVDALVKCDSLLEGHKVIMVSISGGSDSDVMMDLIERCKKPHNEIHYVFFDTGIEFQATKNHIKYLEEKYGVEVHRERPIKSIPTSCREHGQPFLSKAISENISRLQKHNFDWTDGKYEELAKKYPKCLSGLKWWCNDWGKGSSFNIERRKWLKEFLIANPPEFKISQKCCQYAKKDLAKKWKKEHTVDLSCIGVRKAEKGQRMTAYKNCFTKGEGVADEYRPIFWFSDKDKEEYINFYGIELSDCYTKYGLKRTGCSGCPYAQDWKGELAAVEEFEPKLAKGVKNIFADSYSYLENYEKFCDEMEKKFGMKYSVYRRLQIEQEEKENAEKCEAV